MKCRPIAVASILAGLLVGCDSNPNGPTFPDIPAGTKPAPADIAPQAPPAPLPKNAPREIAPQPG